MRVASFDIGTNTVLLLIAERVGETLCTIADEHAIARVGEGVDKTHEISEAAYERLRAQLMAYRSVIDASGPCEIVAVATSAMRDATNRTTIQERVLQDCGIAIEIISGADEARFTYRGSLFGLELPDDSRCGVIDVGGGSTELAFGTTEQYEGGVSVQIGAVRLSERAVSAGLSFDGARAVVAPMLRDAAPQNIATLVAVAGTATTLAAMDQHLASYDDQGVHGYWLAADRIEGLVAEVWPMTAAEIVAKYPSVNSKRADILAAGGVVLLEAIRASQRHGATVSAHGLRYGVALRALGI